MLSMIWAEDQNHGIGINNKLPWHIPEDLKHFKKITENGIVVMGKNTFLSLPHPLKNRKNLVLTHDKHIADKYKKDYDIETINLSELNKLIDNGTGKNIFIIGGSSLFNLFKNKAYLLYLTKIEKEYKTDTKMVNIDYNKFRIISKSNEYYSEKEKTLFFFETLKHI